MGVLNSYQLGHNLLKVTLQHDDQGRVIELLATEFNDGTEEIQQLGYAYRSDGNLKSRTDQLIDKKEWFKYDALNRLVGIDQTAASAAEPSSYPPSMEYNKNFIFKKADVGTYNYGIADHAHAVKTITSLQGNTALANACDLTYTHFLKAESITEGDKILEYSYGSAHQRIKSTYSESGVTKQTKYYAFGGNYELRIDENGNESALCYLDGSVVFYDDQTTANNDKMLYLLRDHLGSIMKVVSDVPDDDKNYTVEESFSYDACLSAFSAEGRRRHATNWTYTGIDLPTYIDRGFTGHEMLDEFNLVNANGRIYDPVIGYFLSPDPYVQSPSSSQNMNRYAYCMHNPLNYTDPSGEILVPILIGAGISVLTNGINNSVNDRPFFEGAGKAAIIGGIGGAFSFGIGQAAAGMSGFGKVAFQTLAHGHLGGMMSEMSGGTYGQGFLSGAAGSLVATGAGSLFSDASKGVQALGTIGGGALAGGIGAEIAGGNFWDGARNGAISAGLNHGIHSGLFGEGLMMASITGRTRHLFGPDAISMAGTVDASSGVAMGLEKGGLVVLRGKEAGIYNINDLSVGVGGVSVSAGVEVVKLYTSSATVLKSHFYGPRYEANLSFTVDCVNVGGTAIYARHSQGYTVGYGVTLGVDAIPFNIGFQLNKGASSEYFHQLTPELRNTFNSW